MEKATMFYKIRKNAGIKNRVMALEVDSLLSDSVRALIIGAPVGRIRSLDDAMDFASSVMSPSSPHWRALDKITVSDAWTAIRSAIRSRSSIAA